MPQADFSISKVDNHGHALCGLRSRLSVFAVPFRSPAQNTVLANLSSQEGAFAVWIPYQKITKDLLRRPEIDLTCWIDLTPIVDALLFSATNL
jgi:hypothetical protein